MVKHAQYVSVVKDEEKTKSGPMKCITILQNQLAKWCRTVLATNRGEKEDILKVSLSLMKQKLMIISNVN